MTEPTDHLAPHTPQRDRLLGLVSRACDAPLDDDEAAELERLVGADKALLRTYVGAVTNEALLQQSCGLTVHAPEPLSPPNSNAGATSAPPPRRAACHSTRSLPSGWLGNLGVNPGWLALAASVAVVAATAVIYSGRAPASIVATSEAWLANGSAPAVGARIAGQWVELEKGSIDVAFRGGAMATVSAPARFRATGGASAELTYGVVTAHTPDGAHGFRVSTPSGVVTDLGTAFRLTVSKDGASRVYVTSGLVRVEGSVSGSAELRAGQEGTLSADGDAGVATARRVKTSGEVELVREHPASLGYNAFDRDGRVRLFLESAAVRLDHDLRLDVAATGRHTKFEPTGEVLPEGSVVDCYLLHCAPEVKWHEVRGAVRFPREIVGLVCGSDRLNATNPFLGARWTLQCFHAERGSESAPDPNSDTLAISSDRRTLTVHFRTESIDQVRVLVAAE